MERNIFFVRLDRHRRLRFFISNASALIVARSLRSTSPLHRLHDDMIARLHDYMMESTVRALTGVMRLSFHSCYGPILKS